jgi:hypothetical protein
MGDSSKINIQKNGVTDIKTEARGDLLVIDEGFQEEIDTDNCLKPDIIPPLEQMLKNAEKPTARYESWSSMYTFPSKLEVRSL